MSIRDNNPDDIFDFFAGDDLEVRKFVDNIPVGQALAKAWFTVKASFADLDPDSIFQKIVTSVDVPGTGQITDTGATDTIGQVRFDLTPVNTVLLVPQNLDLPFHYDIQVITTTGKVYTAVEADIWAKPQVTQATS